MLVGMMSIPALVAQDDGPPRAGADWPLIGGDLTNARHSPLSEITAQNVNTLGATWTSTDFDDGAQSRSTPVVKNGVMYVTAGPWIYALDAKSGQTVWKVRADERP